MGKGALIGKGMTAEVFQWQQDKVLKLYFDWVTDNWVTQEASIGKAIYEIGIQSPAVYDTLKDEEGRLGIIFERIDGKSMLEILIKKPWRIFSFAGKMARLHNNIHKHSFGNLSSAKEKFTKVITNIAGLSQDKKSKIILYLDDLTTGDSICHGDFHPDNILVAGKGKEVIIDWTNAYTGCPLSDVARTRILITTPYIPPGTPKLLGFVSMIFKKLLYATYLREYLSISKLKGRDICAWTLPIAAARLSENIPGEEKWLLDIIDKELVRLRSEEGAKRIDPGRLKNLNP